MIKAVKCRNTNIRVTAFYCIYINFIHKQNKSNYSIYFTRILEYNYSKANYDYRYLNI